MERVTATAVRRDAISRLIALAGDTPYDPDRMRSDSLEVLKRRALRRGLTVDDPTVPTVVEILWPVARGDAGALYDAVQAGGVGVLLGDDAPPAPTVGELETALADLFGGAA